MKRYFALLLLSLVLLGCSSVAVIPHETKYVPVRGSLCDLYIKLDGEWVKFYQEIGDYSLIESPGRQYLVITDFRGSHQIYVKVYDIQDRKLYDITEPLHKCLPSLSNRVLFAARRFVGDTTVEFGMQFLPKTVEEKPVVAALNKTVFRANIEDLIVVAGKYR
jgi:hypothetical protein